MSESLTKRILDNKQTIHIVSEIVVLCGLVFYFSSKHRKVLGHVEELAQRLEEQENHIQKLETALNQITQNLRDLPAFFEKVDIRFSGIENVVNNLKIRETKNSRESKVSRPVRVKKPRDVKKEPRIELRKVRFDEKPRVQEFEPEPRPEPTPEPRPEPTPEYSPEPTPRFDPEPTPEYSPEPELDYVDDVEDLYDSDLDEEIKQELDELEQDVSDVEEEYAT